ncbi:MAG: hypothetical protein EB828_04565 [Nitrosopumilus sp. D6]|nr:MAG: hypothetical protein EB828_04565 [Nitrosopumilus sp. D6]
MRWKGNDGSSHNDALLLKWDKKIDHMTAVLSSVLKSSVGQDNFTLSPSDGAVWTFRDPDHRLSAFLKHSKDVQNVYFYAVTNGNDTVSDELKIGYARLLEAGIEAYVGRWIGESGTTYIDAVCAVDDGMDDEKMADILVRHGQKSATRIRGWVDKKR